MLVVISIHLTLHILNKVTLCQENILTETIPGAPRWLEMGFLPLAIRRMTEGYIFSLSTFRGGGGVPVSDFGGGVGWGYPVSDLQGGYPVSDFGGGVPGLKFSGGGGYLVSVKGKIFDTRFGLIHVQTGKFFFVKGYPPQ